MNDLSPLEAIFFAALDKGSPRERAAYLDGACADDPDMRRRVEKMLDAQAGSFLEQPAAALGTTVDEPVMMEKPGTVIGPYKLLEQIGEGGFGVVFMAEQTQPMRRKVALKVLKPGMDSKQVVARFEAERQALALMDHPNIARVFDGGTTSSGRLYFVMELVRGAPITDFCDTNHLTPRQRLELFVSVCQAIQHAHQKGVIHRDLKPSNVLVSMHDTVPVVKVIDFGVAKALGQELTDKTLFTGFAQMVGTPLYMSPEQAGQSGLDVDTRSDVYSLGVLLYELLTGTTPFDKQRFKQAGYDEIRRIIREEEPPKPSTRLSESKETLPSISAQRQTEPAKLTRLMRGELDWVVMKALDKDRNRRYETANGFAADIERYLHGEAVLACPPSAAYRLRKFARRNSAPLAFAGLLAAALLLGTVVSVWQAARATGAERLAQTRLEETEEARKTAVDEAAKAQTVVGLLQEMLRTAHPDAAKGPSYTVKQMLDDFEASLGGKVSGQPEVEGDIRITIGQAYRGMGLLDKAEKQLRRALELRRQTLWPGHQKVAASVIGLAWNTLERKDWPRAEKLAREALATLRQFEGRDEDLVRTLRILAMSLENQGKSSEEAERTWREGLHVATRCSGRESACLLADVTGGLAFCMVRRGDASEAEPIAVRAVELHRQVRGSLHTETAWALVGLGECYRAQFRFADAERATREALAVFRRLHGDADHPFAVQALGRHVFVLGVQFKDEEIEATLRECATAWQKQEVAFTEADQLLLERGRAFLYRGDPADAEACFRQAFDVGRKARGPFDLVARSNQLLHLAGALFIQEKKSEAREVVRGVVPLLRLAALDPNTDTGLLLGYAICLIINESEKADDLQAVQALVRRIEEKLGNAKPDQMALALITLALAFQRGGDKDREIELLREAQGTAQPLALYERRLAEKYLIRALKAKGDAVAAERVLREGLSRSRAALPEGHPEIAASQVNLAALLSERNDYAGAESLLVSAHAALSAHPQATSKSLKRRRAEALERLAQLYDRWGKPGEAARWRRELETQKK